MTISKKQYFKRKFQNPMFKSNLQTRYSKENYQKTTFKMGSIHIDKSFHRTDIDTLHANRASAIINADLSIPAL